MGSTKHEKTFVDYDKSYEQNIIGLRGIIYFGIGLFLLIVVTFGLMLVLQNLMEANAREAESKNVNPMQMNKDEQLPPEPRLQAAPGFGVGEGNDRVNLELKAPQSEYWELEKRWNQQLQQGQRDEKTGTVVTLPIEEAKRKLIEQNVKAKSGPEAQKAFEESQTVISYSSAGRLASDKRR